MKIKIEAIDTLFFKDGKPFSMGEETWADGIFPPPPSVIFGALRSAYFSEHPAEFKLANSENDPTKNLIIKSIYFSLGNDFYFPIPKDCVRIKNKKEKFAQRLQVVDNNVLSNLNSNSRILKLLCMITNEEVESIDDGIIFQSSLKRYLNGERNNFPYSRISDFVISEPKVGIGRENLTRSSSEGKLYRLGLKRLSEKKEFGKQMNTFSLIVEFEGLKLSNFGLLRLGAENKPAKYSNIENKYEFFSTDELNSITDKEFLLYLLTPAFFKYGWKPDFNDHPLLRELEIELVSASIGKPILIGGFDMAKKVPKVMRKAVPSGSIYLLKSKSCRFSEIYNLLNGKSISDFNSKEGYGICLIGRIK
ncbi:MAG: type III-B CRISPR module-associated Cmr3 family protein [Ignavibacteria bacterium]|nr:hypothetical protein [Ignavibacteria bacterium]